MEIELTEKEESFLKEFATKQKEGSRDNVGTMTPIHVVERNVTEFVESEDGNVWVCDNLECKTFENIVDMLESMIDEDLISRENCENIARESFYCDFSHLDDCPIEEQKEFLEIMEISARFGFEFVSYVPIAFFFIRDEAVRYKDQYQKHNCANCRIYTYGLGYSNHGDLPIFRELLMKMGEKLNQ